MNHKLTYLAVLAMLAASCSSDDVGVDNIYTLSEDGSKTPIAVQTNLSTSPKTRAFDKTFESGDELLAYIEAGKLVDGTFTYEEKFHWAGNFNLTRKITTDSEEGIGNITSTTEDTDLSPTLYWDDFSSTEYDLRSENPERGIRLKYGYCYNGGEANASNNTSDVAKEAGTLTWTVLSDQSAVDGSAMKKSDLLYAATQEMITYGHDPESRGTLTLPYTHAMSKLTINVTTGEGYATDKANFASSALTMKNMQIMADVDAPADTVTVPEGSSSGKSDITPFTKSKKNTTATYQAIIGPTSLTAGDILASLTSVGTSDTGLNNYNIPLTSGILTAWSAEDKMVITEEVLEDGIAQAKPLTRATIDGAKTYTTKPGIHYILDVTIDKQKITIRATIIDWDEVETSGKGEIKFNADVKNIDKDNTITSGSFDVFHATTTDALAKTTTATYTDGKWTNSPYIYWENSSTDYFFRGLAKYDGTEPSSVNGELGAAQGTDLIWATTAAHKGEEIDGTTHDYAEGAAINPRTGDIPMQFYHAMSKLTMKLETTSDASKVDLAGAKISISNLSTTGSINLVDGKITPATAIAAGIPSTAAPISDYPVIPQDLTQDLTDASIITITLADGTIYKLKLTDCKVTDSEEHITTWKRGKHYTYTIHLEKEAITFRALIKQWDDKEGSGYATLEWD